MKIVFFLSVCFIALSGSVSAQWKSDSTANTLVCNALNSQQNLQSCTDGANGIIIVWEDYRNSSTDIYAQKLDANGVAQWAANGINITNSTWAQTAPVVCSDGSGGAYVAWKDARTPTNGIDLYAQHINSDGTLAYGASGAAIAAATDAAQPANLTICSDGYGSAFVAWEDYRNAISSTSRSDIYMNRLSSGGVAWGGGGRSIISQALHQTMPKIVDDGFGGCYLAWVNSTIPPSIWGTRVDGNGGISWGTTGEQIFQGSSGSSDASRNPRVSRDGNQLCIAWEQINSSNSTKGWNVLANRVKSDGTLVWGTNTAAPEISTDWAGDQTNAEIFSDDSLSSSQIAGLLVVYQNFSVTNSIALTRLLPDGNSLRPAYPNHVFAVCRQTNDQTLPKAVKTGSGELLIVWNDTRSAGGGNTYSSIYAQRCDKTPKRFLGSSPATSSWGVAVSNRVGSNADEVTLVPRTNGGIAAWRDNRNGNFDIYAQLIFRDGTLPVELSDFSVKASENGKILLNWQTSSEKENAGFEVERRTISDPNASNNFEVVGSYETTASLRGSGFSNSRKNYSFLDEPNRNGVYEYRLADISLDGERTTHQTKTIHLQTASSATTWSVAQNYPNPFKEKTSIGFETPVQSIVQLDIFDALGRKIASPVAGILLDQGFHTATISSEELPSSSAYYYTLSAYDPESKTLLWKMPKAALMRNLK